MAVGYIGEMVACITADNTSFDHSIDSSQKKFLTLSQTIANSGVSIANSFKQINGEATVWGNSVDLIKQKQEVLKNEISNLISQGVDPLDDSIEKLQNQYYKLGQEALDFARKHKSLQTQLSEFSDSAIKIGRGLTIGITAPLVGLGIAAVKSSAEMEMLETSFSTMLGSASEAAILMTNLKKMAAATPFETTDLANVTKSLLQYGVANKDILPTLQMIGDVSGGNSAKFAGLSYQFAQMIAAGRLLGTDLRSMVNNGFNPLQEISRTTGESMASLQDKMSKGAITTEMVTAAFKSATSVGGKFFGGMAAGSKTLEGLVSTLKDDLAALGRSFADQFIPSIKDGIKWLSSLAQKFTALDSGTKTFILTMAGFAAATGPVLLAVGSVIKIILSMQATAIAAGTTMAVAFGPASLVAVGLIALAATISLINSHLKETKAKADAVTKALKGTSDITTLTKAKTALEDKIDSLKREIEIGNQLGKTESEMNKLQNDLTQSTTDLTLVTNRLDLEYRNLDRSESKIIETGKKLTKEEEKAIAIQKEITAARDKSTKNYNEELQKINLKVTQGRLTEEEADDAKITAADEYIDMLNDIIVQYDLTEGATVNLANKIISENRRIIKTVSDEESAAQDSKIAFNQSIIDGIYARGEAEQASKDAAIANWIEIQSVENITFKSKIQDIDEAKKAFIDAGILEVDAEKWATKEKIKLISQYADSALSQISSLMSQFSNLYNQDKQNQLDAINAKKEAALNANDDAMEAALKAAGVADSTAIQSAELALAEAKEKGDAETILAAEKALKKAQIEQEYADKAKEIEKQAAIDAHEIEVKQFKTNQALSIAQAAISGAQAILKALELGPIAGPIAAAVMAGLTGYQISVIKNQEPPTLNLAEGGIIPARNGGVTANLAEAGKTEVVFPLDKLESFLSRRTVNNYSDTVPINMVIKLSEREIYKGIFNATKNHTVLIDATALV